eukprot:INCI16314.2.p1 GENE.INCI16314.2~~INCI16314.2.p1  ORF type:complete len:302 (+),score=34.33 INCI16314.2:131-1036(+)
MSRCMIVEVPRGKLLSTKSVRLRTTTSGCKQQETVSKEDAAKGRLTSAIVLLVWRAAIFLWLGILAWIWGVNLYAFTNVTYTFTWIYFLYGTIISIRGVVGLTTSERCFSGDPNGKVSWFGTIFAVLYENVTFSVMYVDVVFWTLLANSTTPLDIYNIHLHGPANAVVLLVEIFISATPSCWANMISSAAILQVYAIFFWIYYWSGWGCYPYPFMNTNEALYGASAEFAPIWMIVLVAGVAVIHLVLYGFDALGNAVFRGCYQRRMKFAHCCKKRPEEGVKPTENTADDGDAEKGLELSKR